MQRYFIHNLKHGLGFLALSVLLGACSQARSGIGRAQVDEVWRPQEVCQSLEGLDPIGCFEVELNITRNEANISVLDLGLYPTEVPYRVLARRDVDSSFTILADNVQTDVGGRFSVKARSKHFIEEYTEWRFETTTSIGPNGVDEVSAPAGSGDLMAQVVIYWPELSALYDNEGSQ